MTTPIDMSDPLVLIEGNMRFSAPDSHTNTTTYTGSTAIGCQIAYRTAINADDAKKITYRLNLGICYGGGSRPTRERFWYRVGVMRNIPSSFLPGETSQDFGYLAVNEYTDANTDYGEEELDLSNVTGTVYLVLMCHGWTSEIDDIGCLMRIKSTGDIFAIRDWFNASIYNKGEIDEFFIENNDYTAYEVTIKGEPNSRVNITGQTSGKNYDILLMNSEVTKMLFFTEGETIDAVCDSKTIEKVLDERKFNINFVPYTETVLWDYVTDNGGSIPYNLGYSLTLHDSIDNYKELWFAIMPYGGSGSTDKDDFARIPVRALKEAIFPNKTSIATAQGIWRDRAAKFAISGNNITKESDTYGTYNNSMGAVKVVGINSGATETLLYDYVTDNAGTIVFTTNTPMTLRDDIENYDQLVIEFVGSSGDLTNPSWQSTYLHTLSTRALASAYKPNYFNFTYHNQFASRFYASGRTITMTSSGTGINGIAKVWGVKY